ncbi:hypothetical protein MMC14_007547 [Varicellaria rhodocarpa]|nr:hypothetical protein [Varicellaria rhodocarpa]
MPTQSSLLALPPELLATITLHLPYPDALALRHTHPLLYTSPFLQTNTNVRLKVSWLVDRKERGLRIPQGNPGGKRSLSLKTDGEFCIRSAGGEVGRIMEVRRAHGECKSGGECEVVRGRRCVGKRRRGRGMMQRRSVEMVVGVLVLGLALLLWRVEGGGGLLFALDIIRYGQTVGMNSPSTAG